MKPCHDKTTGRAKGQLHYSLLEKKKLLSAFCFFGPNTTNNTASGRATPVNMPPLGTKGKGKIKENRRSRSRNTTPSSVLSAPASVAAGTTAYTDIPLGSLLISTTMLYEDILEKFAGNGGIPDPKNLETLANEFRSLSQHASGREFACDAAMRTLNDRKKIKAEEERELEIATREAEEKANLKRVAEDDEVERVSKAGKLKRRKDQVKPREERPLTHGAHGVARQDGGTATPKGMIWLFHYKFHHNVA